MQFLKLLSHGVYTKLYATRRMVAKMLQADNARLFLFRLAATPRSFITCTRATCIFRGGGGVIADGNTGSVSGHLISALESAYAKLNMKLRGLSPS